MEILEAVFAAQIFVDFDDVVNNLSVVGSGFDSLAVAAFLDRAKGLHDEDRMVRDNCPTALADNGRVRHALRVADLHDAVDDVPRILIEGIVRGTVEGRARAVVVHPKPSSDIQVTEAMPHFLKLGIEARRLFGCALDGADVRHLRADVKVYELEDVRDPNASE